MKSNNTIVDNAINSFNPATEINAGTVFIQKQKNGTFWASTPYFSCNEASKNEMIRNIDEAIKLLTKYLGDFKTARKKMESF